MDKRIFFTLMVLCVLFVLNSNLYAATPTLISKLNVALKEIQEYLVKLSLPAAGVAIASGVLIRKLSFGDEEKMKIGKKIIVNAIFCYGIIVCIDMILKFVSTILK